MVDNFIQKDAEGHPFYILGNDAENPGYAAVVRNPEAHFPPLKSCPPGEACTITMKDFESQPPLPEIHESPFTISFSIFGMAAAAYLFCKAVSRASDWWQERNHACSY